MELPVDLVLAQRETITMVGAIVVELSTWLTEEDCKIDDFSWRLNTPNNSSLTRSAEGSTAAWLRGNQMRTRRSYEHRPRPGSCAWHISCGN
ncbi:MAG: hypothetical protein U0821_05970 [Chloroflexota bacterium]